MRAKVFSINNTFQYLLYIITIGFFYGCSKGNEPEDKSASFGIYLLEDQSITWEDLKTRNLDSLKLKDWITSDKIDFYDYSTHVIYLNVDYNTLFSVPHNDNTPIVVVANEKRCYYGRFSPPQDTTQPHVVIKPLELCDDLVMLEFNPPHRKDIRVNDEVKSSLISDDIFRPGLGSKIRDTIDLYKLVQDTVRLRFAVLTNNTEDKGIYFPQWSAAPVVVKNKVYRSKAVFYNNSIFHSEFAIQPWLAIQSIDVEKNIFSLQEKKVGNDFTYGAVWFSYFPIKNLPDGEYKCFIEFYGAMGAPKEKRVLPNGRMWIGYLRTNTVLLEYNSTKGITIKQQVILN